MITKSLNVPHILSELFILFTLCLLSPQNVYTQDIFDLEHSAKYANYLYQTKQYKLASEEFERVIFIDSTNINHKIKLLKSYKYGGFYQKGLLRAHEFAKGEIYELDKNLAVQYLSILLLYGANKDIDIFLKHNRTLTFKDKAIIDCSNQIALGNYKKAADIISDFEVNGEKIPTDLKIITTESLDHHFKSPFIAASMSTIVPGLGKIYTNNYIDGIFAFVFIAGTAWQAYKGFDKKGVNSISGWIFGGLSVGFYLGNIYGSAKSAKKYNKNKRDETKYKLFDFMRSYDY